jgi:hypothetical protein
VKNGKQSKLGFPAITGKAKPSTKQPHCPHWQKVGTGVINNVVGAIYAPVRPANN